MDSIDIALSPTLRSMAVLAGLILCQIRTRSTNTTGREARMAASLPVVWQGSSPGEGTLRCLDGKTGKPRWTYDMMAPVWGSPLAANGVFYVTARSELDATAASTAGSKK